MSDPARVDALEEDPDYPLALAGLALSDVVKTTVWLKDRADFPGFDATYGEYFDNDPPSRTGLVSEFLVDIRVEIECVAYAGNQ